ncbi:hypothetical protein KO493_11885 [Tamlana agarivorans]|uniref:Uncharacterized protein n=1 Tax=Pseudotamlana agarivorans TaxID=481183 RepID=A0ACC5UAN9_9FLAO|nr:hypothetical protein [Tamlana agarivorans]MBU2951397.1 hypothetical protein [Tamlana agarivorans]
MAVLMEAFLRKIPNDYVLKKEYLDAYSNDIETLILGSSHSYYGLNPAFFSSKTFNAGYISQTLDYDYEILKKYESRLKKIKTVILPISYFSFFEKLEETPESWRVKNYMLYYDMDTAKGLVNYFEILNFPVKTNLKRIISYYFLSESSITSTKLGWGTNYNSENAQDLIESGEPRARVNTYINKEGYQVIFDANLVTVNNIISWCKSRNVKLLLVTTPAFESYCENLNKEQLEITLTLSETIGGNYSNCVYLNLLNDPRFDSIDFYDADHLSNIGAEKLSEIINNLINSTK